MGESRRRLLRELAIQGSRNAVRRSDAMLYAIGIGTRSGVPVDMNVLDELTKESGGYAEPLRSPAEITAAIARICDDLQSQYLLPIEPAHADGRIPSDQGENGRHAPESAYSCAGYTAAPGP